MVEQGTSWLCLGKDHLYFLLNKHVSGDRMMKSRRVEYRWAELL
jgi:hypothetical protein